MGLRFCCGVYVYCAGVRLLLVYYSVWCFAVVGWVCFDLWDLVDLLCLRVASVLWIVCLVVLRLVFGLLFACWCLSLCR